MVEENVPLKEGYNIDPTYVKEWLPDLTALDPYLKVSVEDEAVLRDNVAQFTKEHGADTHKRALLVGRFQPPHAGHLYLIEAALAVSKKIVIGIGSANVRDSDNPFSALQRENILRKALNDRKIAEDRVQFVYLNDYGDNDKWRDKTLEQVSQLGEIDAVVGNNRWVTDIFSDQRVRTKRLTDRKISVLNPPRFKRDFYRGEQIRAMLRTSNALRPFGK